MSTDIMTLLLDTNSTEDPIDAMETHGSESVQVYTRSMATHEQIAINARATFGPGSPNAIAGNTYAILRAFKKSHLADTFLFQCVHAEHREVLLGSLGTGDTSTTVFAFSDGTNLHKYLDLTTLKVYVNGVLQTITTHYTVSGNYTDPTITFVSAPAAVALTVSYEYYRLFQFASDLALVHPRGAGAAETLASPGIKRVAFSLIEDSAGASYA